MSSIKTNYTIKPLVKLHEFERCVEMQKTIWGFKEIDVLPARFFVVASRIGGQVFGAFSEHNALIGFLVGIPGWREGRVYIHSHMLAVEPEFQNHGVARTLKLEQRRDAIERGMDLVEWTFDPLELKNAYFNIEKLGVIIRRYSVNHYGLTSSRLQAGLPTDRFVVEWWLKADRVRLTIGESKTKSAPVHLEGLTETKKSVAIPRNIEEVKRADIQTALKIQIALREQALDFFNHGYAITHFKFSEKEAHYIFEPLDSLNLQKQLGLPTI